MVWLLLYSVIVTLAAVFLGIRLALMRGAAGEISAELSEKLNTDTNTLISISGRDKAMRRLAGELNTHLKELQRQRRRYTQGDLELKNAVTSISHDLRTPLTAISGYLDLLDRVLDGVEKSETVQRYLQVIRNRTEAMTQLTGELFSYSVTLTQGEGERDKTETVVINRVLEESILGFYAALEERGITPEIHIPEKKVTRRLDPSALSRIFANLLSNALKYSDGDLWVEMTENGEITFSNTASGLDGVQTEQLFDRFYTLESARKSTGLGLSIARVLMERMGGTIAAQYREGRLYLRIALPEEDVCSQ